MACRFFLQKVLVPQRLLYRSISQVANGKSLTPFAVTATNCKICGTPKNDLNLYICSHCLKSGFGATKISACINPYDFYSSLRNRPMRFRLDLESLEKEYKNRMWLLHPDMIQARGGSERDLDMASQECFHLQQTFNELKDPVARGESLLSWSYGQTHKEGDSIDDQELLMDVLEDIEILETTRDSQVVKSLALKWQRTFDSDIESLGRKFREMEDCPSAPTDVQLATCASVLRRLRLILKVVDAATNTLGQHRVP